MSKNNSTNFYQMVVKKTTNAQQTAFLEQLFAKDADLRKQFQKFIDNWETETTKTNQPSLSFVDLEKWRKKVHKKLSTMEFDMDSVYKYFDQGERSYVPHYEAAWEGAKTMLRKKGFEPFTTKAIDYLEKGNLLDGVKILLAMYEGHDDVFEPDYDEENAFEDYNYTCQDIFQESMLALLPTISGVAKTDNTVPEIFDVIFERIQHWESRYKESLVENEWTDKNITYKIEIFEPLLLALLHTKEAAIHLEQLLIKQDLKNAETAKTFLKIAQLKGSQKEWIKTAESFAKEDITIMQQLLEQYSKEGKEKDLYRITKKAFKQFPHKLHDSILQLIQPDKDQDFYVQVLSYNTKISREIEKYRQLKSYLDAVQCTDFINENKKWMDFHVELLAEENRFEDILEIVNNHPSRADGWSSSEGNLNNIILPILNVYPAECFQILRSRVEQALKNGRGRGVYAGVTKWIQHLLTIKGYENQARQYIDDLVKRFNNYRALKDEMRQGGVL